MSVLPGQPTDGSGKVCIHLFVQDTKGLFTEPSAVKPVYDSNGVQIKQKVVCLPTLGRLACNAKKIPAPVVKNNIIHVTSRTDDPRAVTCPKCIASEDYKVMMHKLEPENTKWQ